MKKYLIVLLCSFLLMGLLSCGANPDTIPVNIVFKSGDVSTSRITSRTVDDMSVISDTYDSFGTLLGSYTPDVFEIMVQYMYLSRPVEMDSHSYVDFSPVWPAEVGTTSISDDELALHWANFTNPLKLTPQTDVEVGIYNCFTVFLLDANDENTTMTINNNGIDLYEVNTQSSIQFTDVADSTVETTFFNLHPARFNSSIPHNIYGGDQVFLYGSLFDGYEIYSDIYINDILNSGNIPGTMVAGGIATPTDDIIIPADATSVTVEIVWNLDGIIEQYADDGANPVNGGVPFYVLADGFWNRMGINVVVE